MGVDRAFLRYGVSKSREVFAAAETRYRSLGTVIAAPIEVQVREQRAQLKKRAEVRGAHSATLRNRSMRVSASLKKARRRAAAHR